MPCKSLGITTYYTFSCSDEDAITNGLAPCNVTSWNTATCDSGLSITIEGMLDTDDCNSALVACQFTASSGSSSWIWIVLAIILLLVIGIAIAAGVGFFVWKKKQQQGNMHLYEDA